MLLPIAGTLLGINGELWFVALKKEPLFWGGRWWKLLAMKTVETMGSESKPRFTLRWTLRSMIARKGLLLVLWAEDCSNEL
jgi:hypothetical protein